MCVKICENVKGKPAYYVKLRQTNKIAYNLFLKLGLRKKNKKNLFKNLLKIRENILFSFCE